MQTPETWLQGQPLNIGFLASPHIGRRSAPPSLIVLHSTGGCFTGAVNWFRNAQSKVSAHFVVSRGGDIVQMVTTDKEAWHAGKSAFDGRECVNDFSIGIEMEHIDGKQGWPVAQINAVALLCAKLQKHYGISRIVSHAAVATPAGRKVDPQDFPWADFRAALVQAKQQV